MFLQSNQYYIISDLQGIASGRGEQLAVAENFTDQDVSLKLHLLQRDADAPALLTNVEFHGLRVRILDIVERLHVASHGCLHGAN